MIRATSIAAYRDVSPSRREEVLSVMSERTDWTREEIAERLGWPINRVTGRVKELLESGAIVELGRCRKSKCGKSVNVVRVAN